jgi:hypothetical protein
MPFQKGKSGNPKGRPLKGTTIADLVALEGDRIDTATKLTQRQLLIHNMYDYAIKGDPAFARLLLEREYGKVLDEIQLTDGRRKPLDLSGFSEKELVEFQRLLKKAEPKDADTSEGE